jgi:hypothetical protein
MLCKLCFFDVYVLKIMRYNKVHLSKSDTLQHEKFFNFRFPVAIKAPMTTNYNEVQTFWEEAKSMVEVGTYHDHIVNLQGIVVNEVNHTFLVFILLFVYTFRYYNMFRKNNLLNLNFSVYFY